MTDYESTTDAQVKSAIEAEKRVLGGIFRWPAMMDEIACTLRAEQFYADAHQRVFKAMLELWDGNKPIDLETVANVLANRGSIQDVGYDYLADLWDNEPTGANAVYHAKIVSDRHLQRSLKYVGEEIAQRAHVFAAPADEMLEEAERKILALADDGRPMTAADLAPEFSAVCDDIDFRSANPSIVTGVTTGFLDLDRLTGGLALGSLVIVAARPSVGKTALAAGMMVSASKSGTVPLFISLEQTKRELAERMLCAEAQVNSHSARCGRLDHGDADLLSQARQRLASLPKIVDDDSPQTYLRIAATARRMKRRNKVGVVYIDYLQLIQPENAKAPRQEQVATISRRLKGLARELGIPIVCLAQLNREVESRSNGTPRLSDLRESGAIEADADMVFLLHRPEMTSETDRANEIDIIVAKNRNGMVGTVTLTFRKEFMRFDNFMAPFAK